MTEKKATRKERQLEREFEMQDRRFQRAMEKANSHMHRAEAYRIIMQDALNELNRINRERGR